jgi:hypothetical protein
MSLQFPAHVTTNLSFYRPHAACFIGDSFLRFSKTDIVPTASPPVDPLHTNKSRPNATIGNHPKARRDFLPLPVLSSASRSHLCASLALGLQNKSQHLSAILFGLVRAGFAGVSDYQAFWLILYFILNLALTLYNKVLLVSFPYPYTLTAVHALFGLAGGTSLRLQNVYQPKSLWGLDYVVLVAFSILYSVNIAVSNASLGLVTVPVRLFPPPVATNALTLQSFTKLSALQHRFSPHSFPGTSSIPLSTGTKFPRWLLLSSGSVCPPTVITTLRLGVSPSHLSAPFWLLSRQ